MLSSKKFYNLEAWSSFDSLKCKVSTSNAQYAFVTGCMNFDNLQHIEKGLDILKV